jgi:DNA-directed RNA polymerase subunit RPC12/RpoP
MVSFVGKARTKVVCAHCSKRINWAWVVEYRSFHFLQFIYLCSECASVIKVTNEKTRLSASAEDELSTCFHTT